MDHYPSITNKRLTKWASQPPHCSDYGKHFQWKTVAFYRDSYLWMDMSEVLQNSQKLVHINVISLISMVSKVFFNNSKHLIVMKVYWVAWQSFCSSFSGSAILHVLCFFDFESLLILLEKSRKVQDEGGFSGIIMTDLSNTFDCVGHQLLIAKLCAYGFSIKSLEFINSYLTGRPQGSISGPLLFNIYICDLFLNEIEIDFAN